MKKLLTILGLTTLVVAPTMSIVSCGDPKPADNDNENNENEKEISSDLSDYLVVKNFSNKEIDIPYSIGIDNGLAGVVTSAIAKMVINEEQNKEKLVSGGLEDTTLFEILEQLIGAKNSSRPESIKQMVMEITPFLEIVGNEPTGAILLENIKFDYKLLLSDFDSTVMDYFDSKDINKYKEIFANGSQTSITFTNLTLNFPQEA